ncbi:hypothetical protein ACVTAA_002711, partial [Cronobacter dublinensis]
AYPPYNPARNRVVGALRLPTLQWHRAFDDPERVNNMHPPSRPHFPRQIAPKPASGSQESSE